MSHWEKAGQSDEWYTPRYIFDGLGCTFDLDVAAPITGPLHVPADTWLYDHSLIKPWHGFIWMNPPFGGRNSIQRWLLRFFAHGNGIALTPDRSSAPWWQHAAAQADATLFIAGKIKFIRPNGTLGKSPSNGTTLFAAGKKAAQILENARSLGICMRRADSLEPNRK